jgi:hypothetical protein
MNTKEITLAERDGRYEVTSGGVDDYALIGILECLLFDLKNANRRVSRVEEPISAPPSKPVPEQIAEVPTPPVNLSTGTVADPVPAVANESPETVVEPHRESVAPTAPDLRTRIGNAVKAIRNLGGQIEETDLSQYSDDELQTELDELTNQYKRLKNSKGKK